MDSWLWLWRLKQCKGEQPLPLRGEGDELRETLCAGAAFANPSGLTGFLSPQVVLSAVALAGFANSSL